jgi:hypothetical protein
VGGIEAMQLVPYRLGHGADAQVPGGQLEFRRPVEDRGCGPDLAQDAF